MNIHNLTVFEVHEQLKAMGISKELRNDVDLVPYKDAQKMKTIMDLVNFLKENTSTDGLDQAIRVVKKP